MDLVEDATLCGECDVCGRGDPQNMDYCMDHYWILFEAGGEQQVLCHC